MANKKVSQLVSKPSVLVTDLFPIADPTTGQLYKTTISDLGTAIGSGVSSVNGLVGAVVLDTDDIQELASPTNRWFTDTRAREALSAASPLAYNSGTGVFSIPQADGSTNGFLSSADWTTFNAKQAALSGTGFVKISGTTISYDNSTYLTTSGAASTYLALSGGTLTGALNGTSATFSGDLTLSATNPRLYFTDTDNNPDYFISNTDGTFTIYDVTNSTSRFTIGTTGNGTFGGNLTVGQIIRSGGTSSQFLKADGSVDSTSYQPILTNPVTGTGTSGIVAKFSGTSAITDSIIYDNGTRVSIGANITTTNTFTSVSSTSSAYAVVAQASSSANGIWSNVLGTGEIFRGQTAGGSYFIINNGGNAFLNGNLNVGDFASTSYRLNVVGTANLTGALSGTSATFSGTVTSSDAFISTDGTNTIRLQKAYFGGIDAIYQTGTNAFGIYLGGGAYTAAKLYITNGGNVGIGTSSPSSYNADFSNLVIANTSSFAGMTIATASTSYGTIAFADGTSGIQKYAGYIQYSHTDDAMAFASNATERMRITSSGNVGIGTTNPSYPLVVGQIGSTADSYIQIASTTTGTGNLFFGDTTGQGSGSYAGYIQYQHTGNVMTFGTNNDERMRITSEGNILLTSGTTVYNTSGSFFLRAGTSGDLILGAGGTNGYARIQSNGNLLVGTSSDIGGKLQVNGDIRAYGSFFRETGNITVNNSWTNVFTINTASQRTYLLQIIATNSEASLSYRYFGVIQGNPASSSYTAVSLASQTMEVQFSGATIQTRLTNSNQFNFNWSITQLL